MVAPANFERFMRNPLRLLKLIGISFAPSQEFADKARVGLSMGCFLFTLGQTVAFLAFHGGDLSDISFSSSMLIYYVFCICKLMSLLWQRAVLIRNYETFLNAYPCRQLEVAYKLERHLHSYLRVERFVLSFYGSAVTVLFILPLVQSLLVWWITGQHIAEISLQQWALTQQEDYLLVYLLAYAYYFLCELAAEAVLLGCDLYLYALITQVCLHCDLLVQQIRQLLPQSEDSLDNLKDIATRHRFILSLVKDINNIFTLSIHLSLLSSSLNLCFSLSQLLAVWTPGLVARALGSFLFEVQRVGLMCHHGDILKQANAQVFDALYEHNWLNGSIKYKHMVRYMMLHTIRPKSLMIAGVAEISMLTFRQVLEVAYQLFTFLKSAKMNKH